MNFERVVVRRMKGTGYPTDFLASVVYRVVYFYPESEAERDVPADAKPGALLTTTGKR